MNYICHSGGCEGADMFWENEGKQYGVKTISYSFYNHKQYGENQKILSVEELNEGFNHVMIANKTLKRAPENQYVKNLLARNWYQVKNSEAIYAIGFLEKNDSLVKGGTGWAVQMAIDNEKPVYVFDQKQTWWFKYVYTARYFMIMNDYPILTKNFAGIGTRDLDMSGKYAIKNLYRHNFLSPSSSLERIIDSQSVELGSMPSGDAKF
jgi:hypothetical protein